MNNKIVVGYVTDSYISWFDLKKKKHNRFKAGYELSSTHYSRKEPVTTKISYNIYYHMVQHRFIIWTTPNIDYNLK